MTEVETHETAPAPPEAVTSSTGSATGVGTRATVAGLVAAVLIVTLATVAHLWFAPFVVGVALGAVTRLRAVRVRTALLTAVAAALVGWAVPLVWRAVVGEPVIAAAGATVAVAGLPALGWLLVVVALLVAVIQGMLGVWLSRALSGLFTGRRRPPDPAD
ncbi:MAG TPA: hypothetical protein VF054_19400 [Micromonosporaceae bacterium]